MKKLLTSFACVLLIYGCTTSNTDSVFQEKLNNNRLGKVDVAVVNEHLQILAKSLATEIKSSSLRNLLKEQAMLEVDGDFDVLYSTVADKNIDGSGKLHDKLRAKGLSEEVITDFPSIQISIPVFCKEWDVKNHIPMVVFVPYGEDDTKLESVMGYDHSGKLHSVSLKETPSNAVIVVSISERHDINSGKLLPKYQTIKKKRGARAANRPESIFWMHFQDLGAYEPWAKGRPEIRLVIAGVRNGQVVNPIYENLWKPTRYTVENASGWELNSFAFTWTEDYGMYVTYSWIEEDGGATESQPLSLSWQPSGAGSITSFSTVLPKGNDDDNMGTFTVWKGEPNYQMYGSNFRFKLKFQ